jgi:hypothetical protein
MPSVDSKGTTVFGQGHTKRLTSAPLTPSTRAPWNLLCLPL